ncbi:MAG: helix-turn-helix domain-containing protein [Proteobacteria bacterium]|nr:helix-turn-helix domain-containing protein [Pseudomonadota bacterium]
MNQSASLDAVEITVDQAATLLGTSERMVLNYIKARQIKAAKVGKRWFVDRASIEQFRNTGGRGVRAFPLGSESVGATSGAGSPNKTAALPRERSDDNSEVLSEGEQSTRQHRRKGSGKTVKDLACYRLALVAFERPLWQRAEGNPHAERLASLRLQILEHLGAGYYSFGPGKHHHYNCARSLVGSALALIYSDDQVMVRFPDDVAYLEQELLVAFASLLRKIERLGRKDSTSYRQERDYGH